MDELGAGRTLAHMVKDLIENCERPWVACKGFQRVLGRAADAFRVRILVQRDLLHVPENLFKREFVWSVRRHRPSMFAF